MLTDKSSQNEGEVHICRNSMWSAVQFHLSRMPSQNIVPRLICQQLGFSPDGMYTIYIVYLLDSIYMHATRLIHIYTLSGFEVTSVRHSRSVRATFFSCSGGEVSLIACEHCYSRAFTHHPARIRCMELNNESKFNKIIAIHITCNT